MSGPYAAAAAPVSQPTFEEYDDRTSPGTPLPPSTVSVTPYVTRSRLYAFVVDE